MAYVVIAFSFALAGGIVARIKGNSFLVWFVISGVVPMIGLCRGDPLSRRELPQARGVAVHDVRPRAHWSTTHSATRCGTEARVHHGYTRT